MEEFIVSFPGGKQVAVDNRQHHVLTDQDLEGGGDDAAMSPFDLFLASIVACSGIVALRFLQKRDLPTEGLNLRMKPLWNEELHLVTDLTLDIDLPESFPEKYRGALVRALDSCTVKRHLVAPPAFHVNMK